MDPPEGFDPNWGWCQDPATGKWISFQLPARTAVPPPGEEPAEQQDPAPTPTPNTQPGSRRGPLPRPVFQSSGSQMPSPTVFPTPPSTQYSTPQYNTFSFQPHAPTPHSRTPLGPELEALFEPLPSSPSPEPEAPTPSTTAAQGPSQKVDKGKKRAVEKRAADDDGAALPASKKPKPAPSKGKAAPKDKGKQPAKPAATGAPSHGGRQPGSQNYTDDDLKALLHIVAAIKPMGGNKWASVEERFNIWARLNNRPTRTHKPLKTKFDQMARTPKPTGSAEIPPLIARAKEIERSINARVHLREIDDNEVLDVDEEDADVEEAEEVMEDESEGETGLVPPAASKKKSSSGPVLKTFRDVGPGGAARPSTASRRAQVNDFMSAVTSSLDPSHRETRDEARFARRAAQDELSRLTQDNRDLRNRYDSLSERYHQQSFAYQQAMGEVSCLQSRLDVLEMVSTFTGAGSFPPTPTPTLRSRHAAHWDYDPASRPYASPFPSRPFHPSPRTPPPSHARSNYGPHLDNIGGQTGRRSDHWERDYMDTVAGTSSYDDRHFVSPRDPSPPIAGPSRTSSLPSTSTASGQFAVAASVNSGLETLASVASSSHAPMDSTSITMTFTPSRRHRRRDSSASYDG